jgi:hypothetical protein
MSSLTNKAFTATQYALFSSFYALPGKLLGGLSGVLVDWFAGHRQIFESIIPSLSTLPDKVVGFVPFFINATRQGCRVCAVLHYDGADGPAGAGPVPDRGPTTSLESGSGPLEVGLPVAVRRGKILSFVSGTGQLACEPAPPQKDPVAWSTFTSLACLRADLHNGPFWR